MAIDLGSSKEPSYTNMGVSASNTLASINNNIPILATWQNTNANSGHATVITGYIYDNGRVFMDYGGWRLALSKYQHDQFPSV